MTVEIKHTPQEKMPKELKKLIQKFRILAANAELTPLKTLTDYLDRNKPIKPDPKIKNVNSDTD